MKKIIIIAVSVLLLAGGGAAAYFLMGNDNTIADTDTNGDAVNPSVEAAEMEEDPIYLPLDPAFVVNFEHNGSIRYLQLSLQMMAYEQAVVDKVAANMPAVRNTLILLFSGQDYDALATLPGKEALRAEVLESINSVVRLKGKSAVKEVFFTGFVMQ